MSKGFFAETIIFLIIVFYLPQTGYLIEGSGGEQQAIMTSTRLFLNMPRTAVPAPATMPPGSGLQLSLDGTW